MRLGRGRGDVGGAVAMWAGRLRARVAREESAERRSRTPWVFFFFFKTAAG